ncbi:hypothetical protein BOTBODRAFT_294968 [Botryobasidium botryosum FD-172 SS1]|uniref:Uncharacterized protein n=1 Tax=Botryobasidium botryosum (strain FD-172 SS1) TaxID=930990 RepID=A0A067M1Q9_BOTB1|nr:hypothetical protein BOTBODRAFT_294968 [Botryobasidium botryosum FD-172 SS1]
MAPASKSSAAHALWLANLAPQNSRLHHVTRMHKVLSVLISPSLPQISICLLGFEGFHKVALQFQGTSQDTQSPYILRGANSAMTVSTLRKNLDLLIAHICCAALRVENTLLFIAI